MTKGIKGEYKTQSATRESERVLCPRRKAEFSWLFESLCATIQTLSSTIFVPHTERLMAMTGDWKKVRLEQDRQIEKI